MRKLKLLLALCTMMISVAAFAQEWTDASFEGGKYYFQNVGSGLYFGAGNDWGTQASLLQYPEYLTLVVNEGKYKIDSQVSNGGDKHFFNGSYMDNNSPVELTIQTNGSVYSIANGETYYGYDGSSTVLASGVDRTTANGQWKIISEAEMLASLSSATAENPVDATFLIEDHNFGRNNRYFSNWKVTSGGGDAKKAGANENMNWQQWNATCDINQTIEGLPNGKYVLKVQGFYRPGGNSDASTAQNASFYAGAKSISIALVSSTHADAQDAGKGLTTENSNEGAPYYVPNSQSDASKAFTAGLYENTLDDIAVTDGSLVIGVKNEGTVGNQWLVIDNFRLFYYGPIADLSAYEDLLAAAITEAEAINQEAKMRASVLKDLQDAIKDYKGKTYSTAEEYTNAINAVKNATKNAQTSINSYKIIASGVIPDNSLDGWTCTNTNTFHINTWSVEGNSDGSNMTTPFIENWVAKGSYLGEGTVSYTLEGLEPGEAYYAQALVRSYNEASSDAPNGPNFFINDTEVSLPTAGTTFTYNNMSGIYATLGDVATVGEDGKLTLGVKIAEDRNYNWVAFKNVSIQSMSDALAKAIANAEALEGKIPAALYTALSEFVSSHNTATKANIAAINEEVETYKAYVAPYSTWKTIKANAETLKNTPNDNADATTALATALNTQDGVVEGATDVATINQAVSDMKAAMATYCNTANPVGDGVKFDMTFMLTNPNLEGLPTWQKADGWYTEQTDGNSQVMTNGNATSEDGTKTAFFEYWRNPAAANNKFALYQKVTLPAGTYNMTCYAFAQDDGTHVNKPNGVYFYANDVQGSAVNNSRLTLQSIEFVNTAEQEVKIGLKTVTGNENFWMGIGYVELYKVQPKTFTVDEGAAYDTTQEGAGTVTLKRTINADTWNTIWLPFSMTESDLKTAFGDDVAIAEYSESAEGDASTVTFTKMATPAISANTPVLLKTSTAGTSYTIPGRTVVAGTPVVAGSGNFDFVGTYAASASIAEGDYFIQDNKLWKRNSTKEITIKGTRAYIKAKEVGANIANFYIDGIEATAIEALGIAGAKNNGKIYNLNGQEVKSAQKGIYIQNGKKVIK